MERAVPLAINRSLLAILIALAALRSAAVFSEDQRELLLAASAASSIPALSAQETRKLYLGVPVEKNGITITPFLNISDTLLFEVFLQQVTFMSADAYERQVKAIVFRLGGQRPPPFRDAQRLIDSLRADPNAVTFLWARDLEAAPGLKRVATLWTGATD